MPTTYDEKFLGTVENEFGPKPLIFSSESASQLMADVMALNPRLARVLKLLGIVAGIVVEAE
ncbi:MAG: hypothetical protein CMJ50_02595 [Planctomycetaceae bacterium]|nr:hypothetical protein [Planctomycetaceae bacterium]